MVTDKRFVFEGYQGKTYLFFFQAEDGIRDLTVTGVQTCALPISERPGPPGNRGSGGVRTRACRALQGGALQGDRKSTRLNSSHSQISYAVFCLKKKKRRHLDPEHDTCVFFAARGALRDVQRASRY